MAFFCSEFEDLDNSDAHNIDKYKVLFQKYLNNN